jgi:CRP-like cAMP-binding protein
MSSTPLIDLDELKMNIKQLMPMEDTQIEVFLKGMKVRIFKKDEDILSAGEMENYLSIVISGLTRHYLIKDGEDISFDFSFQNDFNSSYASFVQREPSRFYIEALQPTVLASFSYDYLHKLYEDYPGSNLFGRVAIEQYFVFREKRELSLLMDNATERYQKLLKEYPEYIQQIPLKYLASYLNIKPESLSRIRKNIS